MLFVKKYMKIFYRAEISIQPNKGTRLPKFKIDHGFSWNIKTP